MPILPFTKKVKKVLTEAKIKDIVIAQDVPGPNGKTYTLKVEFIERDEQIMCHIVLLLEKEVVIREDVYDFMKDCERLFKRKELKELIRD